MKISNCILLFIGLFSFSCIQSDTIEGDDAMNLLNNNDKRVFKHITPSIFDDYIIAIESLSLGEA